MWKTFKLHSAMIKGRISTKSRNYEMKILMKLHSYIINKDFDAKVVEVEIVEEYLE